MTPIPQNWKEARRLQAWRLKQNGWPQRQSADALGVSAAAVSQWMQRVRDGGLQALRHRPPLGAPRRLAIESLTRLPAIWRRGPEAYGCRGQVWTHKRVAEVMWVEWGVMYHPTHVGRVLKALRWSPQKPRRRAPPRDEAAITQWRDDTWPAIKKGRKPSA